MANNPTRSDGRDIPVRTINTAVEQARELVDQSRYYDAETVLADIVDLVDDHPATAAETVSTLETHHDDFCAELETPYVTASTLHDILDKMQAA